MRACGDALWVERVARWIEQIEAGSREEPICLSWDDLDALTRPAVRMGHGQKVALLSGEEARLFEEPGPNHRMLHIAKRPAKPESSREYLPIASRSDTLYEWRCSRCIALARSPVNIAPDRWWSRDGQVFCPGHYYMPETGMVCDG